MRLRSKGLGGTGVRLLQKQELREGYASQKKSFEGSRNNLLKDSCDLIHSLCFLVIKPPQTKDIFHVQSVGQK